MDPIVKAETIRFLVAVAESTGFVGVHCHREFDPPIVRVGLPFGLALEFSEELYHEVREPAGLPDGVCG